MHGHHDTLLVPTRFFEGLEVTRRLLQVLKLLHQLPVGRHIKLLLSKEATSTYFYLSAVFNIRHMAYGSLTF